MSTMAAEAAVHDNEDEEEEENANRRKWRQREDEEADRMGRRWPKPHSR